MTPWNWTFKADVGAEEQEDNNETKDVRTHWVLDSFPITTTTNYQKLHVIKRHKFLLVQSWRLRVQNHFAELQSECGQEWLLLEALGDVCFCAFSSFWRMPAFLGSWLLPLITTTSCFCYHLSYFLLWPSWLPHTGTLVITFRAHPDNAR